MLDSMIPPTCVVLVKATFVLSGLTFPSELGWHTQSCVLGLEVAHVF